MADAFTKENGGDLKQSYRAVKEDVGALRRDVGQLAHAVGEEAKERAGTLKESLQERGEDALVRAQAYVREKPTAALGIAAGVGLLIGLILARR